MPFLCSWTFSVHSGGTDAIFSFAGLIGKVQGSGANCGRTVVGDATTLKASSHTIKPRYPNYTQNLHIATNSMRSGVCVCCSSVRRLRNPKDFAASLDRLSESFYQAPHRLTIIFKQYVIIVLVFQRVYYCFV